MSGDRVRGQGATATLPCYTGPLDLWRHRGQEYTHTHGVCFHCRPAGRTKQRCQEETRSDLFLRLLSDLTLFTMFRHQDDKNWRFHTDVGKRLCASSWPRPLTVTPSYHNSHLSNVNELPSNLNHQSRQPSHLLLLPSRSSV